MTKFIQKIELETEMDFYEANRVLEQSEFVGKYDSEDYYKERTAEAKKFVGTYEIEVERKEDFEDFKSICYRATRRNRDFIYKARHYLEAEEIQQAQEVEDKKVDFIQQLTFEEWQTGKLSNGMKLGKKLVKEKQPKAVLDFYAMQVKTEKKIYFTVSDRPQDIAGMTFYTNGEWNSCQNTEDGSELNRHIMGALADTNLLVAQLHYNLEDVEDMEGNLLARYTMRQWSVNGKEVDSRDGKNKEYSVCKAVRTYGGHEHRGHMIDCIRAIKAFGFIEPNS